MIWCIKTYIIACVKTQKIKIYYPLCQTYSLTVYNENLYIGKTTGIFILKWIPTYYCYPLKKHDANHLDLFEPCHSILCNIKCDFVTSHTSTVRGSSQADISSEMDTQVTWVHWVQFSPVTATWKWALRHMIVFDTLGLTYTWILDGVM